MDVLAALRERRALRAIDPRPVPRELQAILWEAVQLAPSAGNSQPVRLLVAEAAGVRKAVFAGLSEGNRKWAGAAPLLVALAADPAQDSVARNRDGSERELWSFHAGIAMGNLLVQATALGLIAHPLAGFDEASVRDAFGAPDGLRVLAVIVVGYPGPVEALPDDLQQRERAPRQRLPTDHVVAIDRWDARLGIGWKAYREGNPSS